MTETEVAKVNLADRGGSKVATGVTLLSGEGFTAKKEVILSGGTIKSPQTLELSGIGSTEILRAAGVAQDMYLPGVVENLQDHPRFDKLKSNAEYAAHQLKLWEAGKFSASDYAASAYSYQNWSSILVDDSASLVEAAKRVAASMNNILDHRKVSFLTNPTLRGKIAQAEFILSDGYTGNKAYPTEGTPFYGKGFTTIVAGLMHPLARGYVHINSSSPSAHPVYNPASASNEYDLHGLVTMAKYIRTIAQTPPFSKIWQAEYEPGLDVVQTGAEWEACVKNNTNTFYHPVRTCAMLPREYGGVVGPNLIVYGTSNLRIVDASVIPILVSAHPQTGVYGIAERAAEIISSC